VCKYFSFLGKLVSLYTLPHHGRRNETTLSVTARVGVRERVAKGAGGEVGEEVGEEVRVVVVGVVVVVVQVVVDTSFCAEALVDVIICSLSKAHSHF